jgi:single-stranded-DNA-specific exonuclease
MTHLAWGEPELAFAVHVHERDLDLRQALRALYAALRRAQGGGSGGTAALADAHPVVAGRCLRVLAELDLVDVDGERIAVPPPAGRTALERSPSFVAYERRLEEGRRWLSRATPRAA